MVKSKGLTEVARKEIEVLSKEGKSVRENSTTAWSKSTVQDTLGKIKKHGVLKCLSRSGRKRNTAPRIDQTILTLVENSVKPNATDIAKQLRELELVNISPRTVRNRLHQYDLYGRALAKKRLLTKRYISKRLAFAKKYQNWTVDDWKKVLWLDETKICLNGSDGRRWTWRRPGELMEKKHIKQIVKHNNYVMAWRCFSWNGVKSYSMENSYSSKMVIQNIQQKIPKPGSKAKISRC